MPSVAPAIETGRVWLRPHELDDFEAYVAMWGDPGVVRFIGGRPRTREESWIRFLRHFGMWSLLGYGFWAIEEKATGRFIGEAGFHDLKRDVVPSIEGIPEIAWALVTTMHGKGIATEVVSRAVTWGDQTLGAERTVCIIDPENMASRAVAGKCGYAEVLRTTYLDRPTILFERRTPTGP